MSMSKNPFDSLPDELVETIFRKLPLWHLKSVAKVDKRSRRIVRDLKPRIQVIKKYDVELCIRKSNLLILKADNDIVCDDDAQKRFFKLFLELVSNFKNLKSIQGSHLIMFSVHYIGENHIGWKQLASMIPNLESLFGETLRRNGLECFSLGSLRFAFMQHALLEDPTSNPCGKDIIGLEGIVFDNRTMTGDIHRLFRFLDSNPHLTFKFATANSVSFDRYLVINDFKTRLTRLEIGIDKFLDLGICFPNVDLFNSNGEIDLKTFPAKLSAMLPNLKKFFVHTDNVEAINNIWKICDTDNKITYLHVGYSPNYDPPIRQLYEIMSREDRKLEYVTFKKHHKHNRINLHIIRKYLSHEMNLQLGVPERGIGGLKNMFFETKNLIFAIETDRVRKFWCNIRDMFMNMPDFGFDKLTQVEAQQVTQRWIQETCDNIVQ